MPGVSSNSWQVNRWCYLTTSSSAAPFYFFLQSFPQSRFFQKVSSCNRGRNIGASASATFLPMNTQGWFPLCQEPAWGAPPMAKVMRKEARHTQRRDRASGVPLDIIEHLSPKTTVCLLYCFVLSPLTLWGLSPTTISLSLKRVNLHLQLISSWAFRSDQISCSVVSDSLRPHESQHARPPCISPIPGVHTNSRPWSQWCHPTISSSVVPFSSCPQSLPASESFPMSQLFAWGGQSTGVSTLASFLPKKSQGWSPLKWTSWISLQSKGLSRVFSNTTVQKHQFFGVQPSLQSNSHIHTWPLEKP